MRARREVQVSSIPSHSPYVRAVIVLATALLATALVGCGSNETTADLPELQSCLSSALPDYEVGKAPPGLDQVAADASVGALRVLGTSGDVFIGTNQDIRIVAEETTDEAESAKSTYEDLGSGSGQVEQYGTVVVAAAGGMTDDEQSAIEGCLDDQGVG